MAGRVVDAEAHADECVVQAVDGVVEAADQLARGARLLGAGDDVERHAVDVRQQPPEAASRRDEVRPPVARRQQARRHHAGGCQPFGHRHDVAVHLGREDRAHRLQHGARSIGARQQVAAVDEAGADARDRRAVPAAVVGQDVRADVAEFAFAWVHYFLADSVIFTGAASSRAASWTAFVQLAASVTPPPRLLQSDPM